LENNFRSFFGCKLDFLLVNAPPPPTVRAR
jgi:hypothetical protein